MGVFRGILERIWRELRAKMPFGENLGENNGEKKFPSNTIELHELAMPLTE